MTKKTKPTAKSQPKNDKKKSLDYLLNECIREGTKFLSRTDYLTAVDSFTKGLQLLEETVIEEQPKKMQEVLVGSRSSLLYHRAEAYLQCYEYERAIQDVDELSRNAASSVRNAMLIKAKCLQRMDRYDECIQILQDAAKEATGNVLVTIEKQLKFARMRKSKFDGQMVDSNDLFVSLPDEILGEILAFVPASDILVSISLISAAALEFCRSDALWHFLCTVKDPVGTSKLELRTNSELYGQRIFKNWRFNYRLLDHPPVPIKLVYFNPTKRSSSGSGSITVNPLDGIELLYEQVYQMYPNMQKDFPNCRPTYFFHMNMLNFLNRSSIKRSDFVPFTSLLTDPIRFSECEIHIVLGDITSGETSSVGYCSECRLNCLTKSKCPILCGKQQNKNKAALHRFI